MKSGSHLSIWFFTGVCLAVNGALIFATGIYETMSPPAEKVVLYDLHANIWWGAFLLILGLFFSLRYSPARERARVQANSK
jgi:high-affinity Fe2+/Pb2+ permease